MSLPSELCCPTCRGPLAVEGVGAACRVCDRRYSGDRGWLDFLPDLGAAGDGLGPRLMHSRALARVYERLWRPMFFGVASGGLPDYRAEFEAVLAALASAEGGAVVDLSCGPGFTGRRLAESGRFTRVFGLDWSLAMLARAAADNRGLMRLIRSDVANLPFKTASLAGAHAGAAFHMWPDPASAVAEVARVVRPGGAFVASTFAHTRGLRRRLEVAASALGRFHVFEVDQLRGMLGAHGLVDFECERRGSLILFWARRAGAAAA
ncbi:class I SAM-dependent methyltransferase [Nannocystis bainbridge]|uniref:Methyltransferase domain-containing protein n=1 Tax=Nannocystis bainbridge TaxID=2995303 RepID=A0ABT5DTD9_9BACT|nr:methyltransferase domain-containing protein [Nannocystis bainbridge]MDC0716906.1 methyltransferase domain-containing protein [Nannocystis bainbridge]